MVVVAVPVPAGVSTVVDLVVSVVVGVGGVVLIVVEVEVDGVDSFSFTTVVECDPPDEPVGVVESEDFPVMLDDALLVVKKVKLSESRVACVQFGRGDDIQVTVVTWDRPISDDLYKLMKPLPADMFKV